MVVEALLLQVPLLNVYVNVCVPADGLKLFPVTPVPDHVPPEGEPVKVTAAELEHTGP